MKYSLTFIFAMIFSLTVFGQESKLAQQYFKDGEFEKAATLYEKLYEENPNNDYYFDRFIEALMSLQQYEEAEKAIKKQLKKNPKEVTLYVTYGNLLERQFKDNEAKEQYETAIKKMPEDRFVIVKLANAFINLTKFDLATETYEKGVKLLNDPEVFAYNLGDLYRRKGDNKKMIDHYLNSLQNNPTQLNSLKTLFQRYLTEEDFEELQRQLYERIQESKNDVSYPELLSWVFIQRKDYESALRQVRALDRQLNENGGRVYNLAEIAANDKDYDTAIEAYNYIIEKKGVVSSYYIDAKREALRCKRLKLVQGYTYTQEELRELEQEYLTFLEEFGRSKTTATIVAELAELEAFYLNDLGKAIELLTELIEYPGINKYVQAEGKLSLADFYLMKSERWESTLLYSQVDKAFTEDILGHEARFRNAKLSYYMGDFEWAQAQFDILKASTSKLIANDALDLSIFIMDNLGLDTTAAPLQLYADAELLVFQNRFEDAFVKLDSIKMQYPTHGLEDDVMYLKAKVYIKKREYDKAVTMYEGIIANFPEEIRADNSLYELATLYENQLSNKEKAMELYEKLFIDYSGSTFAVEARKRFRILRGDNI